MNYFLESLYKLYGLELFEDVITLLELMSNELSPMKDAHAANIASIAADSYFQCDKFVKSQEVIFKEISKNFIRNISAICWLKYFFSAICILAMLAMIWKIIGLFNFLLTFFFFFTLIETKILATF